MSTNKTLAPGVAPVNAAEPLWSAWVALRHHLAAALTKLRRERQVRRGIAGLAELDDRLLRDIGIERIEIARAARFGHDGV